MDIITRFGYVWPKKARSKRCPTKRTYFLNFKRGEIPPARPGATVACGNAGQVIGSRQHAENWNHGGCGRRVAYLIYSAGYKAWIEPKKSYENWAEAFEDYTYKLRCG
jgi:hypothetical protein